MVDPRLKLKQLHWEREGFELLAWDWWCWASIPLCALCFHIIWKLPSWTFTVDLTLSFLPRWFVPWLCLPHVYNYRRFLQAGRLQHVWFLQRDARSSWIYRSKYELLSFASKILLSFLISPFKVFQAPAAGTECVICMLEITAEELQFWILWRRCARLFLEPFLPVGLRLRWKCPRKDGMPLVTTPCEHRFHEVCLERRGSCWDLTRLENPATAQFVARCIWVYCYDRTYYILYVIVITVLLLLNILQ